MKRAIAVSATVVLILVASVLADGAAFAQTTPTAPGKEGWQHTAAIYLLAAGMSGKSAIGSLDADVDVSFSEILSNLEVGGMAAYRGTNGKWSVMVNSMVIGLGGTKDLRLGGSAEVDFDQTMLEVDSGRRIAKGLELYFGLRGTDIDMNIELRPVIGPTLNADDRHSWVDPLVGIRYEVPMGSKWTFVGRGDVGGFGVGSDFAWQAMTHFDWRLSKGFGVAFGYTALKMDYKDGEGSDFFKYDILGSGPFAAGTFHF
jgi:hypothetical protein